MLQNTNKTTCNNFKEWSQLIIKLQFNTEAHCESVIKKKCIYQNSTVANPMYLLHPEIAQNL